jgi:hypothetical protein
MILCVELSISEAPVSEFATLYTSDEARIDLIQDINIR